MTKMDEIKVQLEAEYCPPLDTSLLRSILGDYETEEQLQQARSILDELKQSAEAEELSGFDASGSATCDVRPETIAKSTSIPESNSEHSGGTDLTSISEDLSSLDIEGQTHYTAPLLQSGRTFEDLDELDEDTKTEILLQLFEGQLPKHTVQHCLRSCKGNFNTAMELLLNQVYFAESESGTEGTDIAYKGIDAFSENGALTRPRKGKGKSKHRKIVDTHPVDANSQPASSDLLPNKWKTSAEDIEFIATRAGLSTAAVSSIYHKCGASLPDTIASILKTGASAQPADADRLVVESNVKDLRGEFPSLGPESALALVHLTYPSTASARELAKTMSQKHVAPSGGGGIQIIPNYLPPTSISDVEAAGQANSKSKSSYARLDTLDAPERAAQYASLSRRALEQEASAHRLAKSNHLMNGARAHYAEVRREYSALALRAIAASADSIADRQSSPSQLDLHNIDVLNAVRIAQARVDEWWAGMGEKRVNGRLGAGERQAGFSIIVGLGKHSEGGKGKLGPAVSKMLKANGWKFESAGAVIVVKGKSSR